MPRHSNSESLVRWIEAEQQGIPIDPADRRHIEEQACGLCRDRLEATRAVYLAFQAPALASPPAAWRERALETLLAEGAQASTKSVLAKTMKKAIEEVRAALMLDTHAGALLPGIRGAMTAGARQILFEASTVRVHLRIDEATPGRYLVDGQVVPEVGFEGLESGRATLRCGKKTLRAPLSTRGEFTFKDTPPGPASLRIEWGSRSLIVETFTLPAPGSTD